MHTAIRSWPDKIGEADWRGRKQGGRRKEEERRKEEDEEAAEAEAEAEAEGGGGGRTAVIKSNNPHLAGGEQKKKRSPSVTILNNSWQQANISRRPYLLVPATFPDAAREPPGQRRPRRTHADAGHDLPTVGAPVLNTSQRDSYERHKTGLATDFVRSDRMRVRSGARRWPYDERNKKLL